MFSSYPYRNEAEYEEACRESYIAILRVEHHDYALDVEDMVAADEPSVAVDPALLEDIDF